MTIKETITLNISEMFEDPRVSLITKELFADELNEINEYYSSRQNDDDNDWFTQKQFCEYLLKCGWFFFEHQIRDGFETNDNFEHINVFEQIRSGTKECAYDS
tara:strand:- start:233 stop:541 length:309 start_codon:yes stop_codon:yes gene_type:complete